jgi:hypothetical protein
MAYTHLLDTNIISDLVRNPTGPACQLLLLRFCGHRVEFDFLDNSLLGVV